MDERTGGQRNYFKKIQAGRCYLPTLKGEKASFEGSQAATEKAHGIRYYATLSLKLEVATLSSECWLRRKLISRF
ncbi:hypothetical protein J6590_037023 [Homalodisca vitripennis]|nr:hypothetical protein J6590_037023 [Homalodisca vitripennis]